MEGVSLLKAFKGESSCRKTPLFWEHEGNRAVRDGDWKLVSVYDNEKKKFLEWELYNLSTDRSELNDLSQLYPERTGDMIRMYDEWAGRAGIVSREIIDAKRK